jgi:hypothetical protein
MVHAGATGFEGSAYFLRRAFFLKYVTIREKQVIIRFYATVEFGIDARFGVLTAARMELSSGEMRRVVWYM